MPNDLFVTGFASFAKDNDRGYRFAPYWIWNSKDRCLADVLVPEKNGLNLSRVHVKPSRNEHLTFASNNGHEAIFGDLGNIAAAVPSVTEDAPRRLVVVPVLTHHIGTANPEFAWF